LDEQLYYKTNDVVLLRCLSQEDAKVLMGEVHEGVCGAHQSAYKMKWIIRRSGYFLADDVRRVLQRMSRSPASVMNPIIKPWPFRGWGIDIISQIYPPSSKGHKFIVVVTEYFTKWVEEIPLKMVTSQNMIDFVQEHIIYQFGIP
jgi:hypothetical protein